MPNGPQLPPDPSPSTQNQFVRIEFTTPLNRATVLDPSSPNGLTSQARLTTTYWRESPPTNLIVDRTRGLPLIGGVDHLGRTWTNTQLNIDPNTPIVGGNVFIFVADRDGNPGTVESFLPEALAPQNPPSGAPRQAQLQVTMDTGILSAAGRALTTSFCTAFSVGQDTIPPTVVSSVPAPDATNIPINSDIEVSFSEPVDPTSLILGVPPTGTVDVSALSGPNALPLNGTISVASSQNSCTIVFRPQQAFPGRTLIQVTLEGGTAAMPPNPPTAGIRDLVGNRLINPITGAPSRNRYVYTFRTGDGPELSNNPVSPEAIYFGTLSPTGIGVVEANYFDMREDIVFPQNESGALTHQLSDAPADIMVGTFISTFGGNAIGNPPRDFGLDPTGAGGNPPCPVPGLWCAPGAVCPGQMPGAVSLCNGACQLVNPMFPPPQQVIGNFLFVSNPRANAVHVLNSNTFQIIKDIPTPEPSGMGITPALEGSSVSHLLYVGNFGASTLSVIDIDRDANGVPRGTLVRAIPVGNGPRGVAVESANEDVMVCNSIGNSVSVIRISSIGLPQQNPVRLTLSGSVGPTPWDVSCGYRIARMGFMPPPLLTWYAFITNRDGNSVGIYEAGPPLANGYGRDGIVDTITGFSRPMGLTDDFESVAATALSPAINITGCWVANNGSGIVSHLAATDFRNVLIPLPNPPPGYARASWEVLQSFQVGTAPVDVALNDPFALCTTARDKTLAQVPGGAPFPQRVYVSDQGEGRIKAVQISNGIIRSEMTAPSPGKIAGYYKQ
jgi:hypothetical protein